MATYHGSCHCGRTRFEVDLELDHVRSCDCSVCTKRGALIHRVAERDLRILTPLSEMALYQWHTRTARDYFCPVCGIFPFRRPRHLSAEETEAGRREFTGWSVNVRCLEGVDLDRIPTRRVHGKKLP